VMHVLACLDIIRWHVNQFSIIILDNLWFYNIVAGLITLHCYRCILRIFFAWILITFFPQNMLSYIPLDIVKDNLAMRGKKAE
jgi:hypothetical protein